ncbi:MAG TPA: hypothetical protein VMU19_04910, partial [Bryobacteraceae bacterium]|nr:hypothetical protein [Bryobacteraceae bacterium]
GWLAPAASLEMPSLAGISISDTFLPVSRRMARPRAAESTEVPVLESDAARAMASELAMPRPSDPVFDISLDAASHVEGPRPEPVESLPASQEVVPAARNIVPITAIRQYGLPHASCSYGHPPAAHAAAPVESLVLPSFHAAMLPAIELALPAFSIPPEAARSTALEPAAGAAVLPAPRENALQSHAPDLRPVRKVALARPESPAAAPAVAVPEPGFVQLEFYCQRPTASLSRKMQWLVGKMDLVSPGFAVRPIFEKQEEEAAPQKKVSKKPAMAEIFTLPEAKRKAAGPQVGYAIKAIAACLVMGGVLWFGAQRIGSRTPAMNRDVSMIDNAVEGVSETSARAAAHLPSAAGPAPRTEPHGAMASFKRAIANRAAVTVTDSFRGGMEAWGAAPKGWAPGWSRHPEGYVQTGQLAFFRPTLQYSDYRLEFFGQIEHKSIGWTVRSKDSKNYYAMKFSVVDPGLRPIIAMVHYSVVAGRKSRSVETPLGVMVHNNTPFQVAVDVKGNRMVTSIDGQEVDTWIDDALPSGGVGFFADAGDKARLYWMKVSKNEDFLGRVCAYISSKMGNGSTDTAEAWPAGTPGPAPFPGSRMPAAPDEVTLAAAVIACGEARRIDRTRIRKERAEPWSS